MYQWEKYKAYPHDHWWANFVRAARLRTEQLRAELGPDAKITWLVYRQGYEDRAKQEHQDLISLIGSVRDKFNLNLVWFGPGSAVINYLNNGQPRDQVKVIGFEYFGHSNRACFMFDYSNNIDSACKSWLHDSELTKINRRVFARHAYVKSWGCHTGEEMSKKWYAATGVAHDWRNWQNSVHDGRTANPHFRRRQVGELRNDEARMTNAEGRSECSNDENATARFFASFGFRHSFVIRHSSFVILLA